VNYLNTDEVHWNGQPVAVVVARTLDAALEAAELVRVTYADLPSTVDFAAAAPEARPQKRNAMLMSGSGRKGDAAAALAAAPVSVDLRFTTPMHSHNALEPHATTAAWDGDRLTVHDGTQNIDWTRRHLAHRFDVPLAGVRVISTFVGGGFGGKGQVWAGTLLAALAAKATGRPVRLMLTREAVYRTVGGRTPSTETSDGSVPADLKLAVIDPGTGKLQAETPAIDTASLSSATVAAEEPADDTGEDDTVALSAMKRAPKPYIYSRAQWGANERLREQSNPSYGTIKTGFVHHTVNANNYTQAQVPSLLRGIYAYHTQSRGWRDIGYNFLVDRFGRIWEGRWGGVNRAVVGAHTSGYNEVSFAMSAIGNFDIASAPQAVLNAYARLFAWKLSMYNIRADAAKIWVKNKYLRAINGHRDAGSTACPGRYLYAKLTTIRSAAQALQNKAQTTTPAPAPAPSPTPSPSPGGPAYTGGNRVDPKCYPASINRRAYRFTSANRTADLVPLQCLLKQQSLYPYAVTGSWNAQTTAGLRKFQARVGHPVRYGFSRSDWTSLLVAGNSGMTLRRGAAGPDVVMVQRALNAALAQRLAVTGTYNAATARAVGIYQGRVGIKRTKVVGLPTWQALRSGRL
jgi:hypothetical protein